LARKINCHPADFPGDVKDSLFCLFNLSWLSKGAQRKVLQGGKAPDWKSGVIKEPNGSCCAISYPGQLMFDQAVLLAGL
jgi:hypothetical protein